MEQLYSYGQCEGSDESCVCVCWGYLRHRLIRLSHLLNASRWKWSEGVHDIVRSLCQTKTWYREVKNKIQNNNDYKIKKRNVGLKKLQLSGLLLTSLRSFFCEVWNYFLENGIWMPCSLLTALTQIAASETVVTITCNISDSKEFSVTITECSGPRWSAAHILTLKLTETLN